MITVEFAEQTKKKLSLFNLRDYKYFQSLYTLVVRYNDFISGLLAKSDWKIDPNDSNEQSVARRIKHEFSSIPMRGIFADLEKLDTALIEARNLDILPRWTFEDLKIALTNLEKVLEEYFGNKTKDYVLFKLLTTAEKLIWKLDYVYETTEHLISKLLQGNPIETDGNLMRLSLYLGSDVTFGQFVMKLDATNVIYNELAQILDVSITDHPIIINKIESGSVWEDILGYPKIISIIERLVENTIGYFYRNFTQEGKIYSMPRNVEAIESVLQLRKELKACNINTDEIDEALNKSSIIIAQKLNILLMGEPKVKVNGQSYYIGDDFEKKYLQEGKSLLLTGNIDQSLNN